MGTPFPWRSPSVGNPVFRHDETSRASCRCLTHHLHESSLLPILSVRVPETATLSRARKDPGLKRSSRGCVLPSSVVKVRAVWPSPWDAELANLRLQRFRLVLALAACCCSLWLSPPGELLFLEHLSHSSRLRRRSHHA